MNDPIREEIFVDLDAALLADTSAAEVERMPSGDPANFPALHVFDDGQGDEPAQEAGTTRYRLRLALEGYVEAAGGAAAHAALNKLYAETVTAIMKMADASPHIEEAIEGTMRVSVAQLASKRRLAFSLDFDLVYATRRGDPTTL